MSLESPQSSVPPQQQPPGRSHAQSNSKIHIPSVLPGLFGEALQNILESLLLGWSNQEHDDKHHQNKLSKEWLENRRDLLQRISQEGSLLAIWREWITTWTDTLQQSCVTAFSHMTSATEIAHIQRLTLHACMYCHASPHTSDRNNSSGGPRSRSSVSSSEGGVHKSTVAVWNAACALLISNQSGWSNSSSIPTTGTYSSTPSSQQQQEEEAVSNRGGILLWSGIFRKPFITQVEYLLKISYHDVFHRLRRKVIRALVAVGNVTPSERTKLLTIDPVTLDIEFKDCVVGRSAISTQDGSVDNSVSAEGTGGECDGDEWSWLSAYATSASSGQHITRQPSWKDMSVRAVRSAEVFLYAERLRGSVQDEVSCLARELLVPVWLFMWIWLYTCVYS